MRIALINENSQAAKNELILTALKSVVEPMGHTVDNYGMYTADDEAQLTYVQVGILGAILLGVGRSAGAEFSFFLGIPTMFGASLLKLVKFGFSFTGGEVFLLIFGMVVAFLVSVYSIKFLMSYIRRNDFKVFGYYRIVLGILVLIYFLVKLIVG